mgnify:FL=1
MNTNIDGGFHDLASLRAELGNEFAGVSDADALKFIEENLAEKNKLSKDQRQHLDTDNKYELKYDEYNDTINADLMNNMKARIDAESTERRILATELANEKAKLANSQARLRDDLANEKNSLLNSQAKLRDELTTEKMKRLYGDTFVWKSPSSIDDYLTKEKIKREVKEELLDDKRKAKHQKDLNKLWAKPKRRPKSKSPKHKLKSKSPKPKSKSPKPKKQH